MKTIKNTKIIGIDHGYGNMKTANHCFKTGISAYDSEPLFTADMLTYNGQYYLIGEGHKEFAPDKVKDEDYYVLTLAAIAKELKAENLTEAHVVIAAGLPLTWTSGQKAEFKAYLMKNAEVKFTYKKKDYHIYIDDVRIYPQGYAAIASFATTLKGVNLIADIGNGTMNVLYMINGKPQQGKMFTEKFGTYQCTLSIREAFMQKTQREINDAIIDEVLITGTANIAPADLKIIKGIAAEYVRDIFRRLRDHGYDENTMLLSPDLRAEERDLKELISDYHFLKENDIHTVSDLQANIDESKAQLSDLERERKKLSNRIRRPKSPEDENRNKERRKEISKQMKPVRERLRRAEKILEKSPHLYELLKQEHELERKARARYLDRSR